MIIPIAVWILTFLGMIKLFEFSTVAAIIVGCLLGFTCLKDL